jgi:hypothetical protein
VGRYPDDSESVPHQSNTEGDTPQAPTARVAHASVPPALRVRVVFDQNVGKIHKLMSVVIVGYPG